MLTLNEYKQIRLEIEQIKKQQQVVTSRSAKILLTKRIRSLNALIAQGMQN
jgi:hypothetical protein